MKKSRKGKNVRVRDGQWHYRFDLNCQEYTGPTGLEGTLRNKKAAEQFAVDERRRIEGEARKAVPMPFAEAAAEFVRWCADVEYRAKPNTAARIGTSFVSAVAFFGKLPVQQIDDKAIEDYKTFRVVKHGVRDITVRHDLHALSVFYRKYAIKQGWAKSNPVELVTIPSDKDAVREHVITSDEEDRYFAAAYALHQKHLKSHPLAQPNLPDVARLMLETGARPEEIMAAKVWAFDPKARTLLIEGGKTRAARRSLNLTDASMAILLRRAKLGSEWLFPSDRNPGHHLTKLTCTHDRVCVEAGVSFVLYDFRHTFATRQIEAGAPVAVVAAIMGHSGLRTIHRYVHPTSEAQKEAMKNYESAQKRRKLKVVSK
jgi:integrase